MTPEQIELVERSMRTIDIDALAEDFYRRAFETRPELTAMFTTDPALQRTRFGVELTVIVSSIRRFDDFADRRARWPPVRLRRPRTCAHGHARSVHWRGARRRDGRDGTGSARPTTSRPRRCRRRGSVSD
jgi:hypothetical protein